MFSRISLPLYFQQEKVCSAGIGLVVSSALLCFSSYPSVAVAATGSLNDTGLTQCYSSGVLVACTPANSGDASATPRQDARFGRDAAFAAGALAPPKTGSGSAGFDFSKICNSGEPAGMGSCPATPVIGLAANNWTCTLDNVTGLLYDVRDVPALTQWSAANFATLTNAANSENAGLGRCGRTGWRVPTERELHSIISHAPPSPYHVDSSYFPNITSSPAIYWSSNPRVDPSYTTWAWAVAFDTGAAWSDHQITAYRVMLVNDNGPSAPPAVFVDNGNGTVSDSSNGLMWDKCSIGLNWNNLTNTCQAGNTSLRWQPALQAALSANTANFRGYNDWRLPNTKELETLMRYHINPGPTIDPLLSQGTYMGADPEGQYWSSTINASDLTKAWYADFRIGGVYSDAITVPKRVRLVRGGGNFDGLNLTATISVGSVTMTTAILSGSASLAGSTGYFVVVPFGSPVPTSAQILAGGAGGYTGTVVASGNDSIPSANTNVPFPFAGLTGGTTYTVYFVAKTSALTSSVENASFTTPTHNSGQPPIWDNYTRAEMYSDTRSIASATVTGYFVPKRKDLEQQGAVFIFAYLPPSVVGAPNTVWYLDSGLNWHLFNDCRVTAAYFTGDLVGIDGIPVEAIPADLSPYIGSELYIGYGMGGYAVPSGVACNDMIARQNWVKVLTVNEANIQEE